MSPNQEASVDALNMWEIEQILLAQKEYLPITGDLNKKPTLEDLF